MSWFVTWCLGLGGKRNLVSRGKGSKRAVGLFIEGENVERDSHRHDKAKGGPMQAPEWDLWTKWKRWYFFSCIELIWCKMRTEVPKWWLMERNIADEGVDPPLFKVWA
jgi:hypothetical protein